MRLLLVDDHEVVRRGVRSLLLDRINCEVCGEAVDGQDALEKARQLHPDLIVMDVSMPRLNGLEATRQVRSMLPNCGVLILSQHESPEMARQALKAGARGYVVKTSISKDLVSAVVKVSRGEYFFDPAILDQNPTTHVDVQEILQRSAAFEQALRESEELYRSTFELTAVGIAHVSPDGKWLRVNNKLCEIVGYSEPELMKLTFQDITHPDDLAADLAQAEKVRKRELETYSIEKRYIRKDGSVVWSNLTVSGVWDSNGRLKHFIAVVEDITERRRAEEALRDSQDQLALALNSSRTAMFDWDIVESRGKWNAQMADLYDFNPQGEYITAEGWRGLFYPDHAQRLADEARHIWSSTAEEFTFEFRSLRKNGEIRWILSQGRIVRDAGGKAIRMIGTHSDITDRKRVEQELRDAEERTLFSLEAANIGTWEWDLKSGEVRWSTNMEAVHGQVPGSFAKSFESFLQGVFVEDREKVLQQIKRALGGEGKYKSEYRQYRADGSLGWMEAQGRVVFGLDGQPTRMFGICTDITERKKAEEATGLLASIVASSEDVIVSKTLDGVITSWNKSAERLFGYSGDEVIGKHITLIIPSERHAEETDILQRLSRGERIEHFETIRRRKDGTLIEVALTISPVKDSSGRVVGASKIARDISARKAAERALATGARQQKALFHLADELHRAASLEQVYSAALNAILDSLQCNRASILLCDDSGTMRFQSWRGLSSEYRAAVDGHSAWRKDDRNPQPVCIDDLSTAAFPEALQATISKEGIGALAFIPLVSDGRLIGKFMVYFNTPHQFSDEEIELSLTIARQLAFAIERKRNDEALRQSEARLRKLSETLDAEVLRQTRQLRRLSHDLLRAQDKERRHIARELHDSAGQTLTVIGLTLDQALNELARVGSPQAKSLDEIQSLVQQLHREIRTTSYLLHPPLLDESGLSFALNWYVQGLAERTGIAITLDMPEDFKRLPDGLELAIFRFVQECLTNVHRHSGSPKAEIHLSLEGESIQVLVADFGKGMSPERMADIQSGGSGVGVRGMQERIRQFGGTMHIDSSETGTRVLAMIPIPKDSHVSEVTPLQAAV